MGRPIKEKFFGNTNSPGSNQAQGGATGVGGEGLATVTIGTPIAGTFDGTVAGVVSAPQLPGGVRATVTIATDGNDDILSVTIVNPGSGYTAVPTIAVTSDTDSYTITNGVDTAAITLTATQQNAIAGLAYITGGSAKAFDIKKQESSRRYLVQTADGQAQCKLVTAAPAAGEMNIIATDANGSTYYVRKLTARRAVLVQKTVNGSFAFADGTAAGWTLGSAAAGIVSIANN